MHNPWTQSGGEDLGGEGWRVGKGRCRLEGISGKRRGTLAILLTVKTNLISKVNKIHNAPKTP